VNTLKRKTLKSDAALSNSDWPASRKNKKLKDQKKTIENEKKPTKIGTKKNLIWET